VFDLNKAETYRVGQGYRLAKVPWDFSNSNPPFGKVVMWEPPQVGVTYTVGVDPAYGLGAGADRSAIHVLRNGTVQLPDIQVAEFCSEDLNVHELANVCYMLGNLYMSGGREALMSVETNIGEDIIYALRTKYNYGNIYVRKTYDSIRNVATTKLGWKTTVATRPKLISKTLQYVKQGWWDLSSPWLINEMQTIEKKDEEAKIQAASGTHDDLYMAAAIALWTAHDMEFNENLMETAEKRQRRRDQRVEAQNPRKPEADYANMPISAEAMEASFWDLLER
jgi:hypothetical protein